MEAHLSLFKRVGATNKKICAYLSGMLEELIHMGREKTCFRILLTGPESSGKTLLAERLSAQLDAVLVEEYAREYLHQREGRYEEADLLAIWRGQADREQAYPHASCLVCDTGPLVMAVWSAVKYGRIHPEIEAAAATLDYDLILLCAPDLPWAPDPLREAPDAAERWRLFRRYQAKLAKSGRNWHIIRWK